MPDSLTLTAEEFRDLITPVLPFASSDFMLPVLNGVRLEVVAGWVTASATDRFRMGIKRIKPAAGGPGSFAANVAAADLLRLLAIFKPQRGMPTELALSVEDEKLTVEAGGGFDFASARLSFALVSGDYPDLRRVILAALAKPQEAGLVGFDPTLLAAIPRAVGRDTVVVRLGNPTTFASSDQSFIGLLMPRRAVGMEAVFPDWTDVLGKDEASAPAKRTRKTAVAS